MPLFKNLKGQFRYWILSIGGYSILSIISFFQIIWIKVTVHILLHLNPSRRLLSITRSKPSFNAYNHKVSITRRLVMVDCFYFVLSNETKTHYLVMVDLQESLLDMVFSRILWFYVCFIHMSLQPGSYIVTVGIRGSDIVVCQRGSDLVICYHACVSSIVAIKWFTQVFLFVFSN